MASPFPQDDTLTRSDYERLRGPLGSASGRNGVEPDELVGTQVCALDGCSEAVTGRLAKFCSPAHRSRAARDRAQARREADDEAAAAQAVAAVLSLEDPSTNGAPLVDQPDGRVIARAVPGAGGELAVVRAAVAELISIGATGVCFELGGLRFAVST